MSEPRDHHYLPLFYLEKWCGSDGKVCRFSRPHAGRFAAERVFPKGTAYERDLYSLPGLEPNRAQAIEKRFLAPVDSDAAIALRLLESDPKDCEWTSKLRNAWTRFLMTLFLRSPQDVKQIKISVAEEWAKLVDPEIVSTQTGIPAEKIRSMRLNSPEETGRHAMAILQSLMDHPSVGQVINNMTWSCVQIPSEARSLLTSDRPIWDTVTLAEPDAVICMPIGPKRLFVARASRYIQLRSTKDLAKGANKLVVRNARKYVFGTDDKQAEFVAKHFGSAPNLSMLQRVARRQKNTVLES